jgi:hypothetical protein
VGWEHEWRLERRAWIRWSSGIERSNTLQQSIEVCAWWMISRHDALGCISIWSIYKAHHVPKISLHQMLYNSLTRLIPEQTFIPLPLSPFPISILIVISYINFANKPFAVLFAASFIYPKSARLHAHTANPTLRTRPTSRRAIQDQDHDHSPPYSLPGTHNSSPTWSHY